MEAKQSPETVTTPPRARFNWRTPFLAILASATLAWSAITQFDVPKQVLIDMLVMSCVFAGTVMACALLVVIIWRSISWLVRHLKE